MNDLEAFFEENLGLLIEPTWPVLADTVIGSLEKKREVLALWALKTAGMFDLASAAPAKIFPATTFREIKAGKIPWDFFVEIAHSMTCELGWSLRKGFFVVNGKRAPIWQEHKGFGFQFVLQFNHLLLRAALIPDAEPGSLENPNVRCGVGIYPHFQWNSHATYTYDNYFEFADSFVIATSREIRDRLERERAQVGMQKFGL